MSTVYINSDGFQNYRNDRLNNTTIVFKNKSAFLTDPPIYFTSENGNIYDHFNFKNINKDEGIDDIDATRNLNLRNIICLTVTIDQISLIKSPRALPLFVDVITKALNDEHFNFFINEYSMLGVVEFATLRGLHIHLLFIHNLKFTKDNMKDLETHLHNNILKVKLNFNGKIVVPLPVIKSMFIKSNASYLNYLKKDIKAIIGNNDTVISTFLNFDRLHIFPQDSAPKRDKRSANGATIRSDKEVIIFFLRKMDEGCYEYQDILLDPTIQNYLHLQNLNSIYQNCYQHFVASHTHKKNVMDIISKFINYKENYGCFCPLLEWLVFQKINIKEFSLAVFNFLYKSQKKNTLVLKGVPDSGKSHIARTLWKLFPLHTRIAPDGIFTFANLINSGCGLWDEPYITPDTVETVKLILERCQDVQIAIKNKGSQKLGKEVPIIITTNHELHRYCSSDAEAINARCNHFYTNSAFPTAKICKSDSHYCYHLTDASNCTSEASTSFTNTILGKRKRKTTNREETCSGYHRLGDEHFISFIAYISHYFINDIDTSIYTNIYDIDSLTSEHFCEGSNSFLNFQEYMLNALKDCNGNSSE